jgi:hypothetical protein
VSRQIQNFGFGPIKIIFGLWLTDPDPAADPTFFAIDFQDANKKTIIFLLITFWRYTYIIFQRNKIIKKSQNSRNQGFSYFLCLMIEGSGSGDVSLTNRSGSRWPKNTALDYSSLWRGKPS